MILKIGQLRQAFSLWIPTGQSIEDLDTLLGDFSLARAALDDFLQRTISFQDYLDIADSCGVDIEAYLEIVDDNLSIF